MENKEIVIDEVDVSNCIAYDEKQCYGSYKYKWCKDNPNCSFKQLAHKTQECEKLKSALEEIEKICLEQNLKWDNIARDILCIINKAKEQE